MYRSAGINIKIQKLSAVPVSSDWRSFAILRSKRNLTVLPAIPLIKAKHPFENLECGHMVHNSTVLCSSQKFCINAEEGMQQMTADGCIGLVLRF